MRFFRRKDKPPKDTDSVEYKRWMANKLDGRVLRYILERDQDGVEIVIGKGGVISVVDGNLSVVSAAKTLFSARVDTLSAWEFMSLEGATLTGYDLTADKERTILAYYKYHRD